MSIHDQFTQWLARRHATEGDHVAALLHGGEDAIPVLSRLGLHLSVIARRDRARTHEERLAVALAFAHTGDLAQARAGAEAIRSALTDADRLALALVSAPWAPAEGLAWLPAPRRVERAAILLHVGETDQAADLLAHVPVTTPDVAALRSTVSCAAAEHRCARIWAGRAFDAAPSGFIDCTAGAPLSLAAFSSASAQPAQGALVSVIMPVFNAGRTIEVAIASVLRQSWLSIELIIVDDGSTDDTVRRAERAIGTDERARLVRHDAQRGTYAARNTGLRQARGAFLAFNDADDASHPLRIEEAVRALGAHRRAAAHLTRLIRIDQAGRLMSPRVFPLIRLNKASLVMRRSVMQQIGMFEEVRFGADGEYIGRIVARRGPGSLIRDRRVRMLCSSSASSLTGAAETGILGRRSAEQRLAYTEDWMRRHVAGSRG